MADAWTCFPTLGGNRPNLSNQRRTPGRDSPRRPPRGTVAELYHATEEDNNIADEPAVDRQLFPDQPEHEPRKNHASQGYKEADATIRRKSRTEGKHKAVVTKFALYCKLFVTVTGLSIRMVLAVASAGSKRPGVILKQRRRKVKEDAVGNSADAGDRGNPNGNHRFGKLRDKAPVEPKEGIK